MKIIKQLKDVNTEQDIEFTYDFCDFNINYEYRKFFERAFGIDILAVYVDVDCNYPVKDKTLDLSCANILLFLKTGRILEFTNSEWGGLEIVK